MAAINDWLNLEANAVKSVAEDKSNGQGDIRGFPEQSCQGIPTPTLREKRSASSMLASGPPEASSTLEPHAETKAECEPSEVQFDKDIEESEGGTSQERWQRTDAYMRDVQQAFRARPAVMVQSNDRHMKMLLVGEPGLGKDTFIKNVFASYCEDNDLPVNRCEPETEPATFFELPSEYCTEVVVDVDDGRTKIHYLMQDTPGTHLAGADTAILKYVVKQNQEYMAKEENPRRVVPLSSLSDPRVDICLYFISPHFLKPYDLTLIAKLSKLVPVVPIIARADALTTNELSSYRLHVKQRLQEASQKLGQPVMHAFKPDDLKCAGAVREVPPFAIISSNEVDHEVGSHWFTRTFPWGRCEVMSSNHSDLPALKSLLLEVCFESLKAATEARFYAARETFLASRALSKALSSGELPAEATYAVRAEGLSAPSEALKKKVGKPPVPSAFSNPKTGKAKARGWGLPWGWAVGFATLAVLVQLAVLGYHLKQTTHLKALIASSEKASALQKQVIEDLIQDLSSEFKGYLE